MYAPFMILIHLNLMQKLNQADNKENMVYLWIDR